MDRKDLVLFGSSIIFCLVMMLFAVLPLKTETHHYSLAIQQEINTDAFNVNTKRSVSGGLLQSFSDSLNFMIQEGQHKVSKTMDYRGDIHFVPGSQNKISYTEQQSYFGETLYVTDVVVTYDKNLFNLN